MVDINSMIQKGNLVKPPRQIIWDVESTGLEPFEHRILCISIMDVNTLEMKSFCEDDEQKILKDFFNEVKDVIKFIGYNNQSFDFPFILQRCLFYGIKIPKPFLEITNQVDLRKHSLGFFISYNKYQKGKLSQWAEKFGTPMETNSGSMMPKLYLDKNWEEIKKHCEEDVIITKRLLDRCKICGVL